MAGTKAGGIKASQTNKDRYGEDFYRNIGRNGGLRHVPKGFSMDKNRAREAGKLGGSISKRTKEVVNEGSDNL